MFEKKMICLEGPGMIEKDVVCLERTWNICNGICLARA
jgi:hypothetical protein